MVFGRQRQCSLLLALLLALLAAERGAGAGAILRLTRHSGAPPAAARYGRSLLLRSARADISGSVHDGYFTAPLLIGTPPQSFDLIVDTGSTMTYVPCRACERCGRHTSPPFDPAASSTSHQLACAEPSCLPYGGARCAAGMCYYSLSYAEASSSEGYLVRDVVNLPGAQGDAVEAVVGCINYETGMIYSQKADGLIAFGNAPRAFPQQIAASGKVANIFGLCFGFPSGGALLLGDAPLPPGVAAPAWTPLLKSASQYYQVELLALEVELAAAGQAAKFVPLPVEPSVYGSGYGTVMDSGTTFNYLPSDAFGALRALITAILFDRGHEHKLLNAGSDLEDICWDLPAPGPSYADAWAAASKAFPTLRLRFGGGTSLLLPPQRYVFAVDGGGSGGAKRFCLGVFDNGIEGTLIGGIAVRDVLVVYDLEKQRVGFSEADCDQLAPAGGPNATSAGTIGGGPPAAAGAAAAGAAAGARAAPGADAAAAAAKEKGKEGGLVAPARPQPPVTAAIRPKGNATAAAGNGTASPAGGQAGANGTQPAPEAAGDGKQQQQPAPAANSTANATAAGAPLADTAAAAAAASRSPQPAGGGQQQQGQQQEGQGEGGKPQLPEDAEKQGLPERPSQPEAEQASQSGPPQPQQQEQQQEEKEQAASRQPADADAAAQQPSSPAPETARATAAVPRPEAATAAAAARGGKDGGSGEGGASALQEAPVRVTEDVAAPGGGGAASSGGRSGVLTFVGVSVAACAAAALAVGGALLLRGRGARGGRARRSGGGFAPLVDGREGAGALDCELAALAATISMDAEEVGLLAMGADRSTPLGSPLGPRLPR